MMNRIPYQSCRYCQWCKRYAKDQNYCDAVGEEFTDVEASEKRSDCGYYVGASIDVLKCAAVTESK